MDDRMPAAASVRRPRGWLLPTGRVARVMTRSLVTGNDCRCTDFGVALEIAFIDLPVGVGARLELLERLRFLGWDRGRECASRIGRACVSCGGFALRPAVPGRRVR